jgi:aerobic carbon-monoxide dehydrogenase small subunit
MMPVAFTVNGKRVAESIEPRMHLADFLRERLNLTATHLRCEQGACGACTLLIDGQPARSCITFAVLCDGAEISTIEGLQDDPVMAALRRAFSEEHGLQCGYCTPGMLVTARDIVMRLPDADQGRIRSEISGNLCRCTGYVGIVRAISRVLDEQRKGQVTAIAHVEAPLGPVGARRAEVSHASTRAAAEPITSPKSETPLDQSALGLLGRQPNIEIRQSFSVSQSPDAVWATFADIAQVVSCLPGASLTRPPAGELVDGKMAVKLGPITSNFAGQARVVRDEARRCGVIMGTGKDQLGGSRAAGEVEYGLVPAADGGTQVTLTIKALLIGPLAQFGRSGIVEDLVARITDTFARNLEARLSGAGVDETQTQAPLAAGSLLWQVIVARVKALFAKAFRGS